MTERMRSHVVYSENLPTKQKLLEALGKESHDFVVIYDKRLLKNADFKKWIPGFRSAIGFDAGEKLKDLASFPKNLEKVLKAVPSTFSRTSLTVIAVGGGSIGDFAGFIASIWKRGVSLVHIPSTWLSAFDSAHGGKTALNFSGIKNQFGTFYPAEAIFIVQDLLRSLPPKELKSAAGELAKAAVIDREVAAMLAQTQLKDFEAYWQMLPSVIEAKYKIVEQDPKEEKGLRQILNLGHTLGHVFEAGYEMPHGEAIGYGLQFATEWSAHRGYLKGGDNDSIKQLLFDNALLPNRDHFAKTYKRLRRDKIEKILSYDKKLIDKTHVQFVFIERIGSVFTKKVTLDSLLTDAERQGWMRG